MIVHTTRNDCTHTVKNKIWYHPCRSDTMDHPYREKQNANQSQGSSILITVIVHTDQNDPRNITQKPEKI